MPWFHHHLVCCNPKHLIRYIVPSKSYCNCSHYCLDYYWLSITLAMIGKFGASAAFGIIYVFSAELFPTVIRNNGIGLSSLIGHIGGVIAPYIANLVSDACHLLSRDYF